RVLACTGCRDQGAGRGLARGGRALAGSPVHQVAKLLARTLKAYATTSWRYERHPACPYRNVTARMPVDRDEARSLSRVISARQLQRVLKPDHLANDPV